MDSAEEAPLQRKLSKVSPAEKKKRAKAERLLQKNKDAWKMYLDFLLRHIGVITTKYVSWERNEFEMFKEAIEKAQRLDEKDNESACTLKKLKLRAGILEIKQYPSEYNMILKFLDFISRMRTLCLISKDFMKAMKKGKLEPLDECNNLLAYWKGFVSLNFDLTSLQPKGVDSAHPGMKYVMWLCLFRTLLNISQKFIVSSSMLTDLPLESRAPMVAFNLTEEQLVVTEKLEETMSAANEPRSSEPNLIQAALAAGKAKGTDTQKLPGEDDHLTFELPAEPPSDAKKGGKGKKGGSKKGGSKKGKKKK